MAYCNMRDWQRCVDAGERAVRGLPLDDVARRHVARAVETARQHLSLAAGGGGGGSRRSGGSTAPPQPPTAAARRRRPRRRRRAIGPATSTSTGAGTSTAPAPAPAPASAPSSASRRGRMSPGGDSPGRLPVEDVAEAALWAAGADSDGDLDAPRPGAAATGAARPDGAAPADEAGAARPAADLPAALAGLAVDLSVGDAVQFELDCEREERRAQGAGRRRGARLEAPPGRREERPEFWLLRSSGDPRSPQNKPFVWCRPFQ